MESGKACIECRPCPECGRVPNVISSLIGGFYIACIGHAETKVVGTREEAVALWNQGQFEQDDSGGKPKQGGYVAPGAD